MAVSNEHRQGPAAAADARKRDVGELSAALAPLEEQDPKAAGVGPAAGAAAGPAKDDAAIVVDARSVKVPRGMATDDEFNIWRPPPVVLVIAAIFLAFIAFIAWQIHGMPPK